MNNFIVLLTYLIGLLPVIFFTAFTPYLTRRSESFGVGIPVELFGDPQVKQIRDTYRNCLLGIGFMITFLLGVLCFNKTVEFGSRLIGLGIGVQLLFMFVSYLQGHRKMKALKNSRSWGHGRPQVVAIETDFRRKKILVSPWWFTADFLMIGITVILGFILYPKLPMKIPIHLNQFGQVDSWIMKSYRTILYAPVMQLLMTIIMIAVYGIIGKAKQRSEAAYPQKSLEQNRIFRYRWSALIVFISVAMNLSFGLMLFTGFIGTNVVSITFSGLMGLVMIWAVILCISGGQGGGRLKVGGYEDEKSVNHEEDNYWKLGIFYYNPEDPALFVEKRFGIGWTVNFGRPMAWVCMGGLIIFIIAVNIIVKFIK